jgi:hypothetical protein
MRARHTFLLVALCMSVPCVAAEVVINAGDCRSGVSLVARDAPLSEVLRKLAQQLRFELQFDATGDSLVNLDTVLPASELITKLSWADSVIVTQARDPRCPARYRIAKVWVLPRAGDRASTRSTAPAAQDQSKLYEQMSLSAKERYDEYVRMHGRPPPGEPEEIGKPK